MKSPYFNILSKGVSLFAMIMLLSACDGNGAKSADGDAAEKIESATATAQQAEPQPYTAAKDSVQPHEKHTIGGMVVIDPEKFASVTVLMGGTIDKLPIHPGQFVKKGEVIATLSNPEFIDLQQNYMEALSQTDFLESEYLRQQKLAEKDAASKKKMQQSRAEYLTMKSRKESAAVRLRLLGISPEKIVKDGIVTSISVTAPISGYVGDINANLGKYVTMGDHICSVIDKDGIRLMFTIFSKDVCEIQEGTRLRVYASSLQGETFHAVVTGIDPIMDTTSNSLKVYAKLTSNHSRLRMGMYVRATTERGE